MRISEKKPHIEVSTNYLKPVLRVHLELIYKPMYLPTYFISQLKINGKIISEYSSKFNSRFILKNVTSHQEMENMKEDTCYIDNYFPLEKIALKKIEEERLKNGGDVFLELKFKANLLSFFNNTIIEECKDNINIFIEQSEWIKNFASQLEIGDFILLELNNPSKEKFAKAISDMPSDSELKVFLESGLDGAYKQLEKSKGFILDGKWSDSILALRPLIETFKTGRNTDTITIELKQYYERSVETDNGWEDFRKLIQNSFDYASKYIHVLGQHQNRTTSQIIPTAREEDAYFVYNLCLSTLYWIKRKIER